MTAPECNGICVTGYDIGVPEAGSAIAYPHPDCPAHWDAETEARKARNEVWDATVPPGGWVCRTCGTPVESEPCADHNPQAVNE